MAKQEFVSVDEDRIIFNKKITRRKFLKGTAAAAATLAVSGVGGTVLKALAEDEGSPAKAVEEKVFQGVCRCDCGGGCHMNVHVRDGKVVKTSKIEAEDPLHTRICQRGLTHAQRIYAPDRVKYPMRRVGERGEDKWEQLTWDEAVEYICSKWKSYIDQYGNTSVMYTYGAGSYCYDWYYTMRLFFALGSTSVFQSYDQAGLYTAATLVTRGIYLHGNAPDDVLKSKYLFCWGANETVANQCKWAITQSAMLDHGAKLIVIDPNFTAAASKADLWVPIRPGTDAALAMAMTKIIIDEGLQDTDYLLKGTVAPFLVKESDGLFLRLSDLGRAEKGALAGALSLAGAASTSATSAEGEDKIVVIDKDGNVDEPAKIAEPMLSGTYTLQDIKVTTAYDLLLERIAEWTPEKASEFCDIPVDTIIKLAHMYAEGPSTNIVNYGIDHWGNGAGAYHALYTMAFVAGQFAKPGASFQGGQGGAAMGVGGSLGAAIFPQGARPGPQVHFSQLPDLVKTGKYGDIPITPKSLYCVVGNPVQNHADTNATLEALDGIELIVVADFIMSDTAKYADIVLPVTHWFESTTCNTFVTPFARLSEKAIEPLYEAKNDIEIVNLLGQGMGIGDKMIFDVESFHTVIFQNPVAESLGLSWEALKEKKNIRIAPQEYIFGADYKLTTPTGRAEFYLENPMPNTYYGQQFDRKNVSLPRWEKPLEAWPDNPLFEKYPLILMSMRDKFKAHSQFQRNPWLVELRPEPTLEINPIDADARGIKHNDYVKVHNDRGYVVLKTVINPGVRPGVVITQKGWPRDQYKDGYYQTLTSRKTDPWCSNNSYFDTLCEVEKV